MESGKFLSSVLQLFVELGVMNRDGRMVPQHPQKFHLFIGKEMSFLPIERQGP